MGSETFAGRTILIVEDEALIAIGIADRFSDAGARVLSANNLRDAMRLAEHPDLSAVVLDVQLGNCDSSAIRTCLKERLIPCVIYSGYPEDETACKGDAYVPKPASPDLLLTTVAELLA